MHLDQQGHRRLAAIATITAALCLALPGVAAATSNRTFVSTSGTDTGDCARPSPPCRNFAYALTQTAAGGEIIAVVLEHLNLVGRGARTGIQVISGELRIRDLSITRFSGFGLRTTADDEPVSVIGSRITRTAQGIAINGNFGGPGQLRRRFTVKDTVLERNRDGIFAMDNVRGTVVDCLIRSGSVGVAAFATNGFATVNVDETTISDNDSVALSSGAGSRITVGRSTLSNNALAFSGGVFSYGDNSIEGHDLSSAPAGTVTRQ